MPGQLNACAQGGGAAYRMAGVGRGRAWWTGTAALALTGVLAACAATAWAGESARGTPAAARQAHGVGTFEQEILPLFRARCAGCHGGGQPNAGLDLRTRDDALQGGHSGPALAPGFPEKSLLYRMVSEGRMPPGGPRLPAVELRKIATWIRAGAPGRRTGGHWAFRAPARPAVPGVRAARLVRNPVDAFLLAKLEARGLNFSPDADRHTLLRRVTFDLIGLPPTPEEAVTFLSDRRPDAYERVVDRLLADPRYGERWARWWLDAAGYADSEGVLEEDRIRPNAWRYRDYVIRSFNVDKPYDQFVREQLAGDELVQYGAAREFTPEIIDALTATGFLRNAVDATRDDFKARSYGEYQYRMLHDTQTIVASSLMGLTIQCARCHDHKYEPLSQTDYYRFQALFMGAVRPRGEVLSSARRQIVAATAAEKERARQANAAVDAALKALADREAALLLETRLRHLEARLESVPETERAPLQDAARKDAARRTPEEKALVARHAAVAEAPPTVLEGLYAEFRQQRESLRQARETEERRRVVLPSIRAFYDLDANPPPTPILIRGEWTRPGEDVEPGIPGVLDSARPAWNLPAPSPGAATTGRRRALAEWLTRPDHPLTARVLVNRVWAAHFGAGLVATVDNLGRTGARPSHPELLDWLARYFVDGGMEGWKDGRGGVGSSPSTLSTSSTPSTRPPVHPSTQSPAWSLKSLHRLMVTSTAYRQRAAWRPVRKRVDPENRLLWGFRPRRLEAEAIRDAVLSVAGTLDPAMFGEPIAIEALPTGEIVPKRGEAGERRSLYLLQRRSRPVTLLAAFDQPGMEVNCTRRTASTTPIQALALLNNAFIETQARQFARRLLGPSPPNCCCPPADPAAPRRIEMAYLMAFARPPTRSERTAAGKFLQEQVGFYAAKPRGAPSAVESAWADFCQALFAASEFVYVE